jgi:hypothetical protein
MIALMLMTFMLFFAFVVNTGMLINAKINLQNAADMAAYAGAATQARQLTAISYLNYEMRRQYKKFLFRYYVLGNMAQENHPKAPTDGPRVWKPSKQSDHPQDYRVPATCLIFNEKDNFCQLTDLPRICVPRETPLDQINQTLRQQLIALEQIRRLNCGSIGQSNAMVQYLWLFNADPFMTTYRTSSQPGQSGVSQEQANTIKVIQGIAWGMGLVPREIILRKRIETLKDYVNAPIEGDATLEKIVRLQNSADPAARERTIQAFLSAYHSLGDHSFPAEDIHMEELMKAGPSGADLLDLQDIKASFSTYAVVYKAPAGAPTAEQCNDRAANCVPQFAHFPVQNLPLGVYKSPGKLTYYAIRLKARARVMFSPFGDMTLKAYAAARPFGSRLGPSYPTATGVFTRPGAAPGAPLFPSGTPIPEVPNLPVQAADGGSASRGRGWDNNFVIGSMYRAFFPQGFDPNNSKVVIDKDELLRAYKAAMVPNPEEGSAYNIMNDLGGDDPYIQNFDSTGFASLWAPIVPPDKVDQLQNVLRPTLEALLTPPPDNPIRPDPNAQALTAAVLKGLVEYASSLVQGRGEDGETINLARLENPYMTSSALGSMVPITMTERILERRLASIRTSWSKPNDGVYAKRGRVGYSVKFVSFDSLTVQKQGTGTQGALWSNDLKRDPELDEDLPFLKH